MLDNVIVFVVVADHTSGRRVPAQAAHPKPAPAHRAGKSQAHLGDANLLPLQQVRRLRRPGEQSSPLGFLSSTN